MNLRLWWTSARKWERECDYNHSVWCSKCLKCVKPHILCLNHIVTHSLRSLCMSSKGVMECLTKYLINQIDVFIASRIVSKSRSLKKNSANGRFKIMHWHWFLSYGPRYGSIWLPGDAHLTKRPRKSWKFNFRPSVPRKSVGVGYHWKWLSKLYNLSHSDHRIQPTDGLTVTSTANQFADKPTRLMLVTKLSRWFLMAV